MKPVDPSCGPFPRLRAVLLLLVAARIAGFTSPPPVAFLRPSAPQPHRGAAPASAAEPLVRVRRPFGLRAKGPAAAGVGGDGEEDFDDIDLEEQDVPADWTEADIAAELGDIVGDLQDPTDVQGDEAVIEDPTADDADGDDGDEDGLEDDDDLDDIVLELEDEGADDDEDDDDDYGEKDSTRIASEAGGKDVSGRKYRSRRYEAAEEDWDDDDDDDDDGEYDGDLLDDPDDPYYMKQKELLMADIAASIKREEAETAELEEWMIDKLEEAETQLLSTLPFSKEAEEAASKVPLLTEDDVKSVDLDKEVESSDDSFLYEPFPRTEEGKVNMLEDVTGITDDTLEKLNNLFKDVEEITSKEPPMMVENTARWDQLNNETANEIRAALNFVENRGPYNLTTWFFYDLGFNVTNLLLAAIKHNGNAPIIFHHWYPQLAAYERYKYVRDRDYDFSPEDVEQADMSELQRYYAGFGYAEIPSKAPAETGVISLGAPDEDELKLIAFDSWMKDVYNPELDRKNFDDDSFKDEDNVCSNYYVHPHHPELPDINSVIEDYDEWQSEMRESGNIWPNQDNIVQRTDYTVIKDEEFERDFRGRLVIACRETDDDLDTATKITERFAHEFGKQVFVETRLIMHALDLDDEFFEIWLESYEIDLLHSKKRATGVSHDWDGPAECDDKQIDWLVEEVRFLISDDSRYSYRLDLDYVDNTD